LFTVGGELGPDSGLLPESEKRTTINMPRRNYEEGKRKKKKKEEEQEIRVA